MFKIKTNKPAFTLIELLVVIAIIGILSALAIVALQNARKNARDAKRISDVKQIQTALELYYNDVGEYPEDATSSIVYGSNVYMATYPIAPTPADGDCSEEENEYTYISSDGSTYAIEFCTFSRVGNLSGGMKLAGPSGIIDTQRQCTSWTYSEWTECSLEGQQGRTILSSSPENCSGGTPEDLTQGCTPPPPPWACGDTLIDSRDSNEYPTIQIGTQCWMKKNLAYLPVVHNNSQFGIQQGANSLPGYGVYNYNGSDVPTAKALTNYSTYGVLYNWFAVDQVSICPAGWSVPTDDQLTTLSTYLGGDSVAGGKMKQTGTTYWNSPNEGATNSSGFTALAAGFRSNDGTFWSLKEYGYFWSTSVDAWRRTLLYQVEGFYRASASKAIGFSVRCIKN